MSIIKRKIKTIDLTPTWRAAARIYIEVLKNPNATYEAQNAAEEDLLAMAAALDKFNAQNKSS